MHFGLFDLRDWEFLGTLFGTNWRFSGLFWDFWGVIGDGRNSGVLG